AVIVSAADVKGKWFDRIVLIIFENTNYSTAIADPYFKSLTTQSDGVLFSNFNAVAHPSLPNYIAQISGSTFGILDDNNYDLGDTNLVDLLEDKGISWKAYAENYPENCFLNATGGWKQRYARKHVPFLFFTSVSQNTTRCAKIVNSTRLDNDIESNSVPQLVYYTPNLDNDAHDTNTTFASTWFKGWLEPKLSKPAFTNNTLFFITFDESENPNDTMNHIYSAMFGTPVKTDGNNHDDTTHYTHYSYLRTVEDNWSLGSLNRNDSNATPFTKYLKGN
ncbi:9132_t:CDS:2, partial [Scutellospora calospora]